MFSTWVVELTVYGPVDVRRRLQWSQQKGYQLNDPFYSDIEIARTSQGVRASVTARASAASSARRAALVFFGQMLDALSVATNSPLYLGFSGTVGHRAESYEVRRIVELEEWQTAFDEARLLSVHEPAFLRGLGWYRKGLYTEDPFDKFLALWNAIEVIASKYHPRVERAKNGCKSQVWECFKAVWGECPQWPNIPGDTNWIDLSYETRKDIAHGIASVEIQQVEDVIARLDTIQRVAHQFLSDWRRSQLGPATPVPHDSNYPALAAV